MKRKGQTEVIVVVALLVVIVVVVATQLGNIIPGAENPDTRNARESVEGFIRAGVLETMETMSDHGGYLSPDDYQLGSVYLNGNEVPYWQYGGQVKYPDMPANLQSGLQSYIEDNSDELEQALPGLELGTPMVGPPVFTNEGLTLSVTMPTTYKDAQVPQPYTVSMSTSMGEIYQFSKDFAVYDSTERPFEYFTLSSMMLSPMENGHHTIPMYEVLVGCGDHIFASSWDVMPDVERAITNTMAHTYMPGKVPENTMTVSSSPKYSLVPINGKRYENIDVSFFTPDGFSLDRSNFRMNPDPASGITEPIPMLGECVGNEPVTVDYTLRYPAIAMLHDPETGNSFQFAMDVYITDNAPASWTASQPDVQSEICSSPTCILEITVQDTSGNPIEDAAVSYMGCSLGRTDSSGLIATLAPCGSGILSIYKNGYSELIQSASSGDLIGTATLFGKPQMNVMIYEVVVDDQGSGSYMIQWSDEAVQPLSESRAHLSFRSGYDYSEHSFYSDDPSLTISTLPAGSYHISASLVSPNYQVLEGAFGYPFTVTEDIENLYIYIPKTLTLNSLSTDDERGLKIGELTEVLVRCGITPVTTTQYNHEEACTVTIT